MSEHLTDSRLRELQNLLPNTRLDLEKLWGEFTGQVSNHELSAFVRWLELRGHIDKALAQEALAEIAVEVTGLDVLGAFYDATATIDFKHGDTFATAPQLQGKGYTMLKQVGAGAMGVVHLAKDRLLRRTVAFKQLLMPEQGELDPLVAERFLSEAQITSQLDHPHVIPIYGLERDELGQVAYTMKMIHGQSLKQWLAEARSHYAQGTVPERFMLEARLRLFLKVLDALAFAHSKGVIHRDLKPANVMLGRFGEVYVMDWGIARVYDPGREEGVELGSLELYAFEEGQIVGTPRYMSPEQAAARNAQLDHRSDLFALGLILFEMVSLRQAIQAKNMQQTLQKVLKRELVPLEHSYGEPIPPALRAIVDKATARRRAERYADVGELAADLRRFVADEKVLAHEETTMERLQRGINRHRQKVLPLLLGLLLLGGGASLGLQVFKQAQIERAEQQRRVQGELLAALADHAQQLSGRFQQYESRVQELAAAAALAEQRSPTDPGPMRQTLVRLFLGPDRQSKGELTRLSLGLERGPRHYYPDTGPDETSWYALGKAGFRWEQTAKGENLTGAGPIEDAQNRFYGVAALELSLDVIGRSWLPLPQKAEIETLWLLDQQGRVLASHPAGAVPPETRFEGSGFSFAGEQFYAFTPLDRLGWQLLVRGKRDRLQK